MTGDAGDGGLGADGVDQAPQGAILGGGEVPLERICGGRTRSADQADVDHTAIVAFDPGADLGFGAPRQDRTVAIDQVVVADLAPAAFLAVPAVDLLALCSEGLASHPVGMGGGAMDDDLVHGIAGAALEDHGPGLHPHCRLQVADRAAFG